MRILQILCLVSVFGCTNVSGPRIIMPKNMYNWVHVSDVVASNSFIVPHQYPDQMTVAGYLNIQTRASVIVVVLDRVYKHLQIYNMVSRLAQSRDGSIAVTDLQFAPFVQDGTEFAVINGDSTIRIIMVDIRNKTAVFQVASSNNEISYQSATEFLTKIEVLK